MDRSVAPAAGWRPCAPEEFERAWPLLGEGPIAVGSLDETATVDELMLVSRVPPTLALSLDRRSPVLTALQRTRRVSLRRPDGTGSGLEAAVVRWVPGGDTHVVVIAAVIDVPPEAS